MATSLRLTTAAQILLAVIGAVALPASAASQPCRPLTAGNPDGNYIVPGVRGDIRYSGDLSLDGYVQPGTGQRPSVVVIHGGGWSSGGRAAHVGQLLELLTRAGYNWFSIDYRLAGLRRFEDSLADVRAALSFIRCHAAQLAIDRDRLLLLGEDSGAQLAALLAAERPAGVIGAVSIGGFYDLAAVPAVAADVDAAVLARASPVTRIHPAMLPMLVVHGGADTESPVDHARRYCRAVADAGGHCRALEVEGASHRVENWWPGQWSYKQELVAWLGTIAPVGPVTQPSAKLEDGHLYKDIVYRTSPELKLDAFVPDAARPTPAVIIVHGGGWEAGDKVTYVSPLFEPLARAGFAWFSVDYRLTPASTHAEQLEDVREAMRFVRARHARFNIDPDRLVLLGESASGQMVSLIATADSSLAGVVSFYGVYDFPAMVTDASPRSLLVRLFRRSTLDDQSRAVLERHSPLYQAHKGMPPLLMINGTGERLWAQAEAFSRRLTALGARHEVIALDGAPHGLENWEGHPEWMTYKERMIAWIRAVVRRT